MQLGFQKQGDTTEIEDVIELVILDGRVVNTDYTWVGVDDQGAMLYEVLPR